MPIAALRTCVAAFAVALYVLLVGPPVLVWTLTTRRLWLIYAAGTGGVRLGFWLAGLRLRLEGEEHIVPGGAVYACNHTSNVEPPAVFLALRRRHPQLRVLYKAEMRKLPVLVWVFDAAGFVPVERARKEQSWPAVDRAAEALREGNAFFIFPEGTRARTDELLPFKKGGFVMAIKSQQPVVPVVIVGGREAMPKGRAVIWPTTLVVRFLPPVPTTGATLDDRDVIIARVRDAITAARAPSPRASAPDAPRI